MFEKLILALARRVVQKQQTAKLTEAEKARQEAYKQLELVYSFVNFLHTRVFRNRHERKTFWRNVMNGQPQVEETIQNIMNELAKKAGKPGAVQATVPEKSCKECAGECSKCDNKPQPSKVDGAGERIKTAENNKAI